jgi:hypothetical protein
MSIGPMGFFSVIAATSLQTSALAAPLAQTQGSDVDRVATEVAEQATESDGDTKAETAAGVGQTDGEEHSANDRDADGRRLWEKPLGLAEDGASTDEESDGKSEESTAGVEHASKDATGESGNQLDLMG